MPERRAARAKRRQIAAVLFHSTDIGVQKKQGPLDLTCWRFLTPLFDMIKTF